MPRRIQRKRIKGWKMPLNTVYVGRPTKWGNPAPTELYGRGLAVDSYKRFIKSNVQLIDLVREELKGKNLACWCELSDPCHADVLLDIANGNNN